MRILSILFFFIVSCSYASELKITTGDWYPYTTPKIKNNGLISNIVTEIFKEMQKPVQINFEPFEKGYKATLDGKYDLTFPYFKDEERMKDMLYSDSLIDVENVLFYNKEHFDEKNTKGIYDTSIGIVKGYSYKNIDIENFKNLTIFHSEIEAFYALQQAKINLIPSNKLVGMHIVKRYFHDYYSNIDYIKNPDFISLDTMHLLIKKSQKNQKTMQEINKALKNIKQNGKYTEIILNNREIIEANFSDVIKLVNNTETFPMVVASKSLDSKEKFIIPRGTKAVVLKWSEHFLKPANIKIYDEMFKKTKVKIIDGPLRGQVLYVDNMYIEID